ncbi:MAG: sigma-54-dependent Fis family transcriptional regulator [Chlamydiia bacterium]|nr:sigma-54-dependent Fis family transcriptional regulator [Chlamydiia bacterium]
METILVVDDDILIRSFLQETLERQGYSVTLAETGKKALILAKKESFDLIFTDMKLPDITGIEVLKGCKEANPDSLVAIITAFGSIENAVTAMKLGAFDYVIKPFTPDAIVALVEKARERRALENENAFLRAEVSKNVGKVDGMIAESPAIKKLLDEAHSIAQSNANVFLHGESGVGKEVFAHFIHHHSQRAGGPFIKVNCAAIPDTLVESEFFGHEKGAFTGATGQKCGRFELANKGTLLLDEVSEIPIYLQPKLLRAIQEKEFERVGGTKLIRVDVRLISTSNRVIEEAIANQILREDLYYRLNVIPIYIPPLRERQEDIIPLAEHFLEKFTHENHRKDVPVLLESAKTFLKSHSWPGNVRQLGNAIERAVVLNRSGKIGADALSSDFSPTLSTPKTPPPSLDMPLNDLERQFILEALHTPNAQRNKAAKRLGIDLETLLGKLKQLDLTT